MATINPYLFFDGTCEQAFNFYKSVFGGEFHFIGKYAEMPVEKPLPPEDLEKIMHVTLPIGGDSLLMGADTSTSLGHDIQAGNHFSLSIMADSETEAQKLFNGLSAGGKITLPLGDTFWGSYFGMFTDKFGINWQVSFDRKVEG